MDRKIKHGLSAKLLISIIFGILGIVYICTSIPMFIFDSFDSVWVLPVLFCVLGIVFIAVAAVLAFVELKKRWQIARMLQENRYLWGEVTEITVNYAITINRRHPYVLLVQYRDGY